MTEKAVGEGAYPGKLVEESTPRIKAEMIRRTSRWSGIS
jgi:hypothetical protein